MIAGTMTDAPKPQEMVRDSEALEHLDTKPVIDSPETDMLISPLDITQAPPCPPLNTTVLIASTTWRAEQPVHPSLRGVRHSAARIPLITLSCPYTEGDPTNGFGCGSEGELRCDARPYLEYPAFQIP